MSLNLSFLAAPGIELVTDMVIRANTGGDKTKEAARAKEIAGIVAALQQINSGDASDGLPALQAALTTSALTPGESLAFQGFVTGVAKQLAAVQAVAGATLLGQVASALLTNLGDAITAVCNAYTGTTASTTA